METVPADLFRELATTPSDLFALAGATEFREETRKDIGEIIWLPTDRLGLILGTCFQKDKFLRLEPNPQP